MADPLAVALEYAAAGLAVFPARVTVEDGRKVVQPIHRWRDSSTRDTATIRAWFGPTGAWGDASLCIDCGKSKIVVVDLDVSDGKDGPAAWAALVVEHGIATTRAVCSTPSGGQHWYYRERHDRVVGIDSSGKVAPGVDIRGLGGFVIAAPSEDSRGAYGPLDLYALSVAPIVPDLVVERMTRRDGEDAPAATTAGGMGTVAPSVPQQPATGLALVDELYAPRLFSRAEAEAFVKPAMDALRAAPVGTINHRLNDAAKTVSHFVPAIWTKAEADRGLLFALTSTAYDGKTWRAEATIASAFRSAAGDWKAIARPAESDAAATESPAVGDGMRQIRLTKASTFTPARVRWAWAGRMPIGELTLVPGREGVGKSLFLAWMTAQLTLGTLPGEFYGQPRAVLYAASEDSWNYTITPRMLAAGADLELVYRITVETSDTGSARINLPIDCRLIPDVARDVNAAALMLDPIVSHVDEKLSVNQSRELRQALEPLREAAELAGIMIPALVHFNKAIDTDVLSKIPGGRAWAEVARAAFALAHDEENDTYVGSQIKNNLGRLDQPHLTYAIDEQMIPTLDGDASVGVLRWTGESEVSAGEVLSRRPERRGRDVSDQTAAVVEFVESAGYPMPIRDIAERFPDIKPNTLRATLTRAAKRGDLSNPTHGHYGPSDRSNNDKGVSP